MLYRVIPDARCTVAALRLGHPVDVTLHVHVTIALLDRMEGRLCCRGHVGRTHWEIETMSNAEPDADVQVVVPEFLNATDPFTLFNSWFQDATAAEPNDPNAMALATVDANGMPNIRVVLLKGLDGAESGTDRGFVFYTNFESAKGRELIASRRAALNFHWKSLKRQVRVRGLVSNVSDEEADAYYKSRPRGSQIGAWASQQSRLLTDRSVLEAAIAKTEERFGEGPIHRPPHWSGFRVTPIEVEFWHDRPFRLHDRLRFTREHPSGEWHRERLYP